MALTLEVISTSLKLESQKLTVFAPSDLAFVRSGQPSLLKLQCHISPTRLPQQSLRTLRYGARIPTLLSNYSLIVTASSGNLTINGVLVKESAIFYDGSMVIYGVDEFFRPEFQFDLPSPNPAPEPSPGLTNCSSLGGEFNGTSGYGEDLFGEASGLLISRGYAVMGTFLDAQLVVGSINETRLTVFAPIDEAMTERATMFANYSTIFRAHVVPNLLSWKDLSGLGDGTTLATASRGFAINLTWSGDILLLNGVPLIFPDLYRSDWLAVHGLNRLITLPKKPELVGESFSGFDYGEDDEQLVPADYGEYGT